MKSILNYPNISVQDINIYLFLFIGDVIPLNRGEMEKKLLEVKFEMGRALYQAEEGDVAKCGDFILEGIRKLEG